MMDQARAVFESDAIAWEARRRGTSYGKLRVVITKAELKEICKEYAVWKAAHIKMDRRRKARYVQNGYEPNI